jgi:hypothetical protein
LQRGVKFGPLAFELAQRHRRSAVSSNNDKPVRRVPHDARRTMAANVFVGFMDAVAALEAKREWLTAIVPSIYSGAAAEVGLWA